MLNIAINTFREIVRNKFLYLIIFFAFCFIGFSLALWGLTIWDDAKVIVDFWLSMIEIFGLIGVLFVWSQLLFKEVEWKTIFLILSKPIKRYEFVLGKFAGFSFTILLIIFLQTLLFLLVLWIKGIDITHLIGFSLLFTFFKLEILLALVLFFSSFMSNMLTILVSLWVYVLGHGFSLILEMFWRLVPRLMKKQDIINLWASLDIPTDDTLLIIQKIMGISSKELFLVYDIDDSYIADIKSAFQQIQSGIPLEYMFGEAEFYGYKFFVNKHTLIPRNDTEILTQKTIEHIKSQAENVSLVDVGTGSWCIGISVYKNLNNKISHTILIDISEQALEVTRKNITLYWYTKNIDTLSWDLFSPLLREPFSNLVVTANLPYIKDNDFDNIDQSVIYHEPHSARSLRIHHAIYRNWIWSSRYSKRFLRETENRFWNL